MSTLSLAYRNILRNRRRSLATVLALVMGAVTILLFGGYTRDIGYALETGYVQTGGHLQIQRKGYFLFGSGNPSAYGIAQYEVIIAAIRKDAALRDMVSVVTPILQFGGVAGNFSASLSRTVLATGMVVDEQNALRQWNDYSTFQKPYQVALTGSAPDAAVVGIGVARILQLCEPLNVPDCRPPPAAKPPAGESLPADIATLSQAEMQPPATLAKEARIELLAATANGAPNVVALDVVRSEPRGAKELDDVYIALHLPKAQRLLYGKEAPKATAIVVQLRHTDRIPAARERLQRLLTSGGFDADGEGFEIQDFDTLNPFYGQAIAMFYTIFGFIAVLICSIVVFTVGNTMGMVVVERTGEIGTLRAIGLRRDGIRRMFVCEGLLLGVIGAGLGVLIGIAVAAAVNHGGFVWTPPGWAKQVPLAVRVWGESELVAGSAIGLALVAVLSAWWPARGAARMNVVEALRHV